MKVRFLYYHGINRMFINVLPCSIKTSDFLGTILPVDTGGIIIEINAENLRVLRENEVELDNKLKKITKRMLIRKKVKDLIIKTALPLRKFQEKGVKGIERRRGIALLADEMGLGKTPQVLAWLLHKEVWPVIGIVPAHLKYNWKDEIHKFTPGLEVETLSSRVPYPPQAKHILLINYEILPQWTAFLSQSVPYKTIFADECHYLQSASSKRSEAAEVLFKKAKYRIMISGTPMQNRPRDLWFILNLLNPNILGGWTSFINEFCGAYMRNQWMYFRGKRICRKVLDTSGTSNANILHSILKNTVMIRRLKKDVMKELPEKIRTIIPVDYNSKEIDRLNEMHLQNIEEHRKGNDAKNNFSKLRLEIGRVKIATGAPFKWIDNYLDTNPEKSLVVVGWHVEIIDSLYLHYKNMAVRITGKDSSFQKNEAKNIFQSGKKRLIFGNVQSIGTGFTLTKADTTLILELPVSNTHLVQLEDRTHRMGQVSESVYYYYMVLRDTVEHRVVEIIDDKKKAESVVINGHKIDVSELLTPMLGA